MVNVRFAFKLIAIALILLCFVSVPIAADDDEPTPLEHRVDKIIIGQQYNRECSLEVTSITVQGLNIESVVVIPVGTDKPTFIRDQLPESPHVFYGELDAGVKNIMVNGDPYDISVGSMPKVNEVLTRRVLLGAGELKLNGANLLAIDSGEVSAQYGKGNDWDDFPTGFFSAGNNHAAGANFLGSTGLKNILFTKKTTSGSADIEVRYEFKNQFHLIEEQVIDELTMFPNQGEKGDQIFFTGRNLPDSSVFFLKSLDGTDPYSNANKGVPVSHQEGRLVVEVPRLEVGEYIVVLTNLVPEGKEPMTEVWRETVVGDPPEVFTVVDGSTKGKIVRILPNQGPDTGSEAEITGLRLGSLNIPNLLVANELSDDDLEISDDKTSLIVSYGAGTYKGEAATITKELKVLIASNATFREGSTFSVDLDRILIVTPKVTDAVSSPVKDVVVETETVVVIDGSGKKYTFKERMVLKGGYTYIPAHVTPDLDQVTPNRVPITDDNHTELDLWLALEGRDFFVYRYGERLWCPVVEIPGVGTGVFDPNNDPDIEMLVLDSEGRQLDGIAGRELGTRILLRLPRGLSVDQPGPKSVRVRNLIRNNPSEYINSEYLVSALSFKKIDSLKKPSIDSVSPNVVSTEGGEQVRVVGGQFQSGLQVLIDGSAVSGVERDGTGTLLTFIAPPGREGKSQLQVINPGEDGGIAVWDFYYVQTYTEPSIDYFAPEFGTEDTLVVIKGGNFLKSDPSANEIAYNEFEANKLIGAKVFLGGKDINQYNLDQGKRVELLDYPVAEKDALLQLSEDEGLVLADYADSVILESPAQGGGLLNYHAIEKDNRGRISIFDGSSNRYYVSINPNAQEGDAPFLAEKVDGLNQGTYYLSIELSDQVQELIISDSDGILSKLKVKTPYQIDSASNKIIGQRVKVVDSNTITFRVPKLLNGYYDLMVVNPDTKAVKAKAQFRYREDPQSPPVITEIIPDFGSYEGGYFITITGAGFQDSGDYRTKVYLDGTEVATEDTVVSLQGDSIQVKVPAYAYDRFVEKDSNRITVPVVVVNSNGGSAAKEFTYVIPSSEPGISRLLPEEGSATGGEVVEIIGKEFVFERDEDGNLLPDTIPVVYFGQQQAEVLDCNEGYLRVRTPPGRAGMVEVFVLNHDGGASNKQPYTYIESAPKIVSISPSIGDKRGGQWLDIHGSDFALGKITLLVRDGVQTLEVEQPSSGFTARVRFGELSNEEIPINQPNSGWISGGNPVVNLPGGLTVDYDFGASMIAVQLNEGGISYQRQFAYNGHERFVNVDQLLDADDNPCPGNELIRLRIADRRLIVERGYSPEAIFLSAEQLRVKTSSYYTIGKVEVRVVNPDGGQARAQFEYRSPDSRPKIRNILKEGREPQRELLGDGREVKLVKLDYLGGNLISVIGEDIRDGAWIQIGNFMTIPAKDINYSLPEKLTFTMPAVSDKEVGSLHRLMLINEDGGIAFSDQVEPEPIYISFIRGESLPAISSIEPDRGPVKGGTEVTIHGKDFREDSQGNPPLVFFGEQEALKVTRVDYQTLKVLTPPNKAGVTKVRVENHDGALSRPMGTFTYISSPTIERVVDPADETESKLINVLSVEGGERIKLKGTGFEEGTAIVFKPELKRLSGDDKADGYQVVYLDGVPHILIGGDQVSGSQLEYLDSKTLIVLTPPGMIGERGILAINKDGGASNIYSQVYYDLPELEQPGSVRAELLYDRYIRLEWLGVEGATEYEVYVIIGDRQAEFVAATELTSFIYSNLQPRTAYRFVIKAVGNFGGSKPSEYSNRVRTLRSVGPEDFDGAITDTTTISKSGDLVEVALGIKDYSGRKQKLTIDLQQGSLAGSKGIVFSMPAAVVNSDSLQTIEVNALDFDLIFNPKAFNSALTRLHQDKKDAGIRFEVLPYNGNSSLSDSNNLSQPYLLSASFFNGSESTQLDYLGGFIQLALKIDKAKADLRKLNKYFFYRYNESSRSWSKVPYGIYEEKASIGTGVMDRLGKYLIIGSRG